MPPERTYMRAGVVRTGAGKYEVRMLVVWWSSMDWVLPPPFSSTSLMPPATSYLHDTRATSLPFSWHTSCGKQY